MKKKQAFLKGLLVVFLIAAVCLPVEVRAEEIVLVAAEKVGMASTSNFADYHMPIASSDDKVFIGYCVGTQGDAQTEVAMRTAPGEWSYAIVDEYTTLDNTHNVPSLIVDGHGYLHVAFDMHNSSWGYKVSLSPNTIEDGFGEENSNPSLPEGRNTYPRFWRDEKGKIYLTWRRKAPPASVTPSRYAKSINFGVYDPTIGIWETVTDLAYEDPHTDGEWVLGKAGVGIGGDGRVHLAFVWTPGLGGTWKGQDLTYAYTDDNGKTWHKTDGSVYNLPITRDQADIIVSGNPDIRTQQYVLVDPENRPHIIFFDGNLNHIVLENGRWSTPQVVAMNTGGIDAGIDPSGILTVVTEREGKVYRSYDGGKTWRSFVLERPVDDGSYSNNIRIDQWWLKKTGRLRIYNMRKIRLSDTEFLFPIWFFEYRFTDGGEPSSTPTPTPACDKTGDVDCDGAVDSRDILLALKAWLTEGTLDNNYREDVNGDGKVNGVDFAWVMRGYGN